MASVGFTLWFAESGMDCASPDSDESGTATACTHTGWHDSKPGTGVPECYETQELLGKSGNGGCLARCVDRAVDRGNAVQPPSWKPDHVLSGGEPDPKFRSVAGGLVRGCRVAMDGGFQRGGTGRDGAQDSSDPGPARGRFRPDVRVWLAFY